MAATSAAAETQIPLKTGDFRRMELLLRLAEGAWAAAVYESGEVQRTLTRRLRESLSSLPLVEITFLDHLSNPHPLRILEAIEDPSVVSITDLWQVMPKLGLDLDLQREGLARLPHRLLFWVTEDEQTSLRENAPNFYSRLSAVYHFPGHPERARLRVKKEGDREYRIQRYLKRLHDLEELDDADLDIAHTWSDLAELYETTRGSGWKDTESAYLEAARCFGEIGRSSEQADALLRAGRAAQQQGRQPTAIEHVSRAGEIYRELEDRAGEANVLQALGDLAMSGERLPEAEATYRRALDIYREYKDRVGEATILKSLGDLALQTNLPSVSESVYQETLSIYQEALSIYCEIGVRSGEASVRQALGDLALYKDDFDRAEVVYREALQIYRELEDHVGEANTLKTLGDLALRTDRLTEAESAFRTALLIYRELEVRGGETSVLQGLGNLALRTDRFDQAESAYREALYTSHKTDELTNSLRLVKPVDEFYLPIIEQLLINDEEAGAEISGHHESWEALSLGKSQRARRLAEGICRQSHLDTVAAVLSRAYCALMDRRSVLAAKTVFRIMNLALPAVLEIRPPAVLPDPSSKWLELDVATEIVAEIVTAWLDSRPVRLLSPEKTDPQFPVPELQIPSPEKLIGVDSQGDQTTLEIARELENRTLFVSPNRVVPGDQRAYRFILRLPERHRFLFPRSFLPALDRMPKEDPEARLRAVVKIINGRLADEARHRGRFYLITEPFSEENPQFLTTLSRNLSELRLVKLCGGPDQLIEEDKTGRALQRMYMQPDGVPTDH